jgi:hypothetical protein
LTDKTNDQAFEQCNLIQVHQEITPLRRRRKKKKQAGIIYLFEYETSFFLLNFSFKDTISDEPIQK